MSCRLFLIVTLSLVSAGTFVSQPMAHASTPLTRATIQALRNQVQLIFKNRVTRAARNADTMTPGDSLATARQAFAELRFNDSSLARIGERTLFQFVPNTRNFYLGNGTALLLIPPGQGRTNVRTPNAAAGIRGSALFVRYNEDTNTTIVGALTNSQIEVSNGENPQAQTLKAGQMAVIIQNQVIQIYNFDLNTFYQTSELVRDLDLPLRNAAPSADPGIAAVQAETAQAVKEQLPLTGQVAENPAFVSLNPAPGLQTAVTPGSANQITLTPSGFDLSTARQALIANPAAQAFTAAPAGNQLSRPVLQPQFSLPNPPAASAAPPVVTPIVLPPVDPQVLPIGTVPSGSLTTPPASTPISNTPSVSVTPSTQVTPSPAASAPPTAPSTATVQPSPAASAPTTAPSTTVQPPTSTPVPVTSTPAPIVQPSNPVSVPATTVQPSTPVPTVTVPQPTPTPAPTVTPVSTPAPRPDPVATPVLTPAVVTPAPTPISPAAATSAVQPTIVTSPAVVTPAPTTVQVQTGTTGTSVQVQTGTTGATVSPLSK